MAQATIDLDAFAHIGVEGVGYSIYIGESGEPAVEGCVSWKELTDNVYEAYCIPDGPIVYDTNSDGAQDILEVVDQLRNAADELEEQVRSSKIFLRDQWIAENGSNFNASRKEYEVSYAEYLNHIMEKEYLDHIKEK
jgi:hypothetical protein